MATGRIIQPGGPRVGDTRIMPISKVRISLSPLLWNSSFHDFLRRLWTGERNFPCIKTHKVLLCHKSPPSDTVTPYFCSDTWQHYKPICDYVLPSLLFCLDFKLSRILCALHFVSWAGQRSWYSDWLWAGRSGDRIPVGARFSAPVQTGSGAHPASCTMGIGSFPGVKSGRGVRLTPHPLLVPLVMKE